LWSILLLEQLDDFDCYRLMSNDFDCTRDYPYRPL
jgi:hypothetical protein